MLSSTEIERLLWVKTVIGLYFYKSGIGTRNHEWMRKHRLQWGELSNGGVYRRRFSKTVTVICARDSVLRMPHSSFSQSTCF